MNDLDRARVPIVTSPSADVTRAEGRLAIGNRGSAAKRRYSAAICEGAGRPSATPISAIDRPIACTTSAMTS
jgi:hypothetical protein